MTLPQDLKKHIRKTVILRTLLFLGILAALCVLLYLTFRRGSRYSKLPIQILCYAAAVLLSAYISGFPKNLKDKTRYGKVTKVEIQSKWGSDARFYTSRENWKRRNTIFLTVQLANGETEIIKATEGLPDEVKVNGFAVGDTVFHLYGTKETVRLPTAASTQVRCPICGSQTPLPASVCEKCGHTLITSPEVIGEKELT